MIRGEMACVHPHNFFTLFSVIVTRSWFLVFRFLRLIRSLLFSIPLFSFLGGFLIPILHEKTT
jgi:hypothetical protein